MAAVPKDGDPLLIWDERDGIVTLTLNRQKQMNLLTSDMLDALQLSFDTIGKDSRIRVVILAATGKGFCAGMISRKSCWPTEDRPAVREMQRDDAVDHQAAATAIASTGAQRPRVPSWSRNAISRSR
jgi:enoyl-CoA hydratase/carnithine racemase